MTENVQITGFSPLHFKGLLKNGVSIKPFGNFTYIWVLPPDVGPTASDPPCLTWMYSSAVDPTRDTNSGLVGPLLICRPGTLNERNKQVLCLVWSCLSEVEKSCNLWGKSCKWKAEHLFWMQEAQFGTGMHCQGWGGLRARFAFGADPSSLATSVCQMCWITTYMSHLQILLVSS